MSLIRFLTAGESHGPALTVIVEGLPAGIPITRDDIGGELARRRLGFGRGGRMRIEQDAFEVLGGVRHGRTLGSPVAVVIRNTEFAEKWSDEMATDPGTTSSPLTQPRPGHADLTGMLKYGFTDARNILERASARETAARVVAGCVAKAFLAQCEVQVLSHVIRIGEATAPETAKPLPTDIDTVDDSPVRCFDIDAAEAMVAEVKAAQRDGDSVGGVFEVLSYGVPAGLGSHVHWDRKIDSLLGGAVMSIQAIKAVEIGDGFAVAAGRGSAVHDEISWKEEEGYQRSTNRSGGTEGGMTTGEVIAVRGAMKPLSTLNRPLRTVDVVTKEEVMAFKERTDHCAVPAAGVVGEAMVAIVLAGELLRKTGGDSMEEVQHSLSTYRRMLRWA